MNVLDDWEEEGMPLEKKQAIVQKGILWVINIFSGLVNPIAWCFIFEELDWFMIGSYVFLYNTLGLGGLYVINAFFRAFLILVVRLSFKLGIKFSPKIFSWLMRNTKFLFFATVLNLGLLGYTIYYIFKWV